MQSPDSIPPSPWLHRFTVATAAATLALIVVGGLVTSHGVGMSVPDWPNTYGYNMFFFPISKWVGGVLYEHSHRLLASGVGLMVTILALWLHGRNARPLLRLGGVALLAGAALVLLLMSRRWADSVVLAAVGLISFIASFVWPRSAPASQPLRRMGLIAFALVVLQGVLGGLRVTEMKDQIGIFHATLAQLFFCFMCALALLTSRWWRDRDISAEPPVASGLYLAFCATTTLILAQLVLGATMRHAHAGLAIPDFPLAYGKLWPDISLPAVNLYNQQRLEITAMNPITATQIELQMIHRCLAVIILASVIACAVAFWRRSSFRNPAAALALGWVALIGVQAVLGAATIWSNKAADVATAHVMVGALSLATGTIMCIVHARSLLVGRKISDVRAICHGSQLTPGNAASASR